jgi:hypothetical protein
LPWPTATRCVADCCHRRRSAPCDRPIFTDGASNAHPGRPAEPRPQPSLRLRPIPSRMCRASLASDPGAQRLFDRASVVPSRKNQKTCAAFCLQELARCF